MVLGSPLVPISGNSDIQANMDQINRISFEGARISSKSEGSARENHRISDFGTFPDSIAGALQVNLTSSFANMRIPDHSSPNHGLFADSLSKGSATWPEEKLPAFTFRSPNLASSELPNNSICDSGDNPIQDQSTLAAWGLVIVTAGLGGEIRTFQNYGWPVRL